MKLYLSSFRMGDRFGELLAALPTGGRVGVISNALDFISAEERAAYAAKVFDPLEVFQREGFEAVDLDLRTYFGLQKEFSEALEMFDLVWAVGGNSFLLRRAMRQSGFDQLVPGKIASGRLIYGGWSAGAVAAGPSLRGIELMDDPSVLSDGYSADPVWEGLGLIDYAIVPHFRSDHPEAVAADEAVAAMIDRGLPFRTLRDGEVVIL